MAEELYTINLTYQPRVRFICVDAIHTEFYTSPRLGLHGFTAFLLDTRFSQFVRQKNHDEALS